MYSNLVSDEIFFSSAYSLVPNLYLFMLTTINLRFIQSWISSSDLHTPPVNVELSHFSKRMASDCAFGEL